MWPGCWDGCGTRSPIARTSDGVVGLRKADKAHANAYAVRKQQKSQSYVVGAQGFTAYHGIQTLRARRFAGYDYGEGVWGFALREGVAVVNRRGAHDRPAVTCRARARRGRPASLRSDRACRARRMARLVRTARLEDSSPDAGVSANSKALAPGLIVLVGPWCAAISAAVSYFRVHCQQSGTLAIARSWR